VTKNDEESKVSDVDSPPSMRAEPANTLANHNRKTNHRLPKILDPSIDFEGGEEELAFSKDIH